MSNGRTIAYVHSGTFPSNSPSMTFVIYNSVSLCRYFERVYLFMRLKVNCNVELVFDQWFSITKPANLIIPNLNYVHCKSHFPFFLVTFLHILFQRRDVEAIVTRNVTFLPFLVCFKKLLQIPVFYETHDFFTDLSIRDEKKTAIRRRNQRLEKSYIPKISGLICLQQIQKELYQKYYPDVKIHVLRTGLLQIIKTDCIQRRYITYIGSFDLHKGLDKLFSALSITKSRPVLLLIGGKNDIEKTTVNELAKQYSYQTNTIVTGWITKTELDSYLRETKVGILPLQDTFFNRCVTSPLKLFDYYAYGIPVVATDLPTTRELIEEGETGYLIPDSDIKTFANCIDKLFTEQNLYTEMVTKVYCKAENLTWDQRAQLFEKLLNSCI